MKGIPILRILTYKSKIGFGKDKDLPIQRRIDLGHRFDLVSVYYKIKNIDFKDDILNELGITEKYRIEKPSKNLDMYVKFCDEKNLYKRQCFGYGSDIMRKQTKQLSKSQLQGINHRN